MWGRVDTIDGNNNNNNNNRGVFYGVTCCVLVLLVIGNELSFVVIDIAHGCALFAVLMCGLHSIRFFRHLSSIPIVSPCTLQAFPIEYLYETFDAVLGVLPLLVSDYSVLKPIFVTLIARIKEEVVAAAGPGTDDATARGLPTHVDVFGKLLAAITALASDPEGAFRAPTAIIPTGTAGGRTGGGGGEGEERSEAWRGTGPVSPSITPFRGPPPEAISSLLEVYTALLSFALTCYPGDLPRFDGVLSACARSLNEVLGGDVATPTAFAATEVKVSKAAKSALSRLTGGGGGEDVEEGTSEAPAPASAITSPPPLRKTLTNLNDECSKLVVALLSLLQSSLGLKVLSLEHYASLMAPLRFPYRRSVALKLLEAILHGGVRVSVPEIARRLCTTLSPLLRDEDGTPSESEEDQGQFLHEQYSVAKLIQLFGGTTDRTFLAVEDGAKEVATGAVDTDTDAHFQVYTVVGEYLSHGGGRRIGITYPPLIFGCLQLARRIRARELVREN